MVFKGCCLMLVLLRVEWSRRELTCDQAVLLPFLFWRPGKKDAVLFSAFPEKKPDRRLGINGLKKKRKGRGLDRSLY